MERLAVAGLFAGVGGIERGLDLAGHESRLLCEIDPHAMEVLRTRFSGIPLHGDVRTLTALPKVDLVAAGFPCQDLSQAGGKRGITGLRSGLVSEVFRLVRRSSPRPRWLLFENVSYMLRLDHGRAMRVLIDAVEELGYMWAYRTIDSRSFGLPQRRQRVVMVASPREDPREVLFADDTGTRPPPWGMTIRPGFVYGFYWTEGLRGIGWTEGAVPTIKGGSALGIPSPPAIWVPQAHFFGTPDLRDTERLQGFPANWTRPAIHASARGGRVRWSLVGNAVPVPVSRWLGRRLRRPGRWDPTLQEAFAGPTLPGAAWGADGEIFRVDVGTYPLGVDHPPIDRFLRYAMNPLSARGAEGFMRRARASKLRYQSRFLADLERFIDAQRSRSTAA